MTGREKIYFISDVHLGAPALQNNKERELLFEEWLEQVSRDAAEIYLMGDIFDFWFEYKHVVPRGYTRILGKIAHITEKGIPVHFFTGNHDTWIFDYLPLETGIIVHKDIYRAELSGKKFFLAHGDGLDRNDKRYRLVKKVLTTKVFQRLYSWLHPDLAIEIAHFWSKHSRMAKTIGGPEFEGEKESTFRYALSVLDKENVDYFIFGHRHRVADMKIRGSSRFILLGEWIQAFSYGVFDGKEFEIKYYRS